MEAGFIVSFVLLWLVVLLNLLLTLGIVRRMRKSNDLTSSLSASGLQTGEVAPNFTAHTLSGDTVTLSTYAGQKVAFIFISTHCGPCLEMLPHLVSLEPKAAWAEVRLVLVFSNTQEEAQAFAEAHSISMPMLVAPHSSNSFMKDYKSTSTPSYCLVDRQGNVQSAGYPSLDWGDWKKEVDSWESHDIAVTNKRR